MMRPPNHFRGQRFLTTLVRESGRGYQLRPDWADGDGADPDDEGQRGPVFVSSIGSVWTEMRARETQAQRVPASEEQVAASVTAMRAAQEREREERLRKQEERRVAREAERRLRAEADRLDRERVLRIRQDAERERRRKTREQMEAAEVRRRTSTPEFQRLQRAEAGRLGGLSTAGRIRPRVVCEWCGRTYPSRLEVDGLHPQRHNGFYGRCEGWKHVGRLVE